MAVASRRECIASLLLPMMSPAIGTCWSTTSSPAVAVTSGRSVSSWLKIGVIGFRYCQLRSTKGDHPEELTSVGEPPAALAPVIWRFINSRLDWESSIGVVFCLSRIDDTTMHPTIVSKTIVPQTAMRRRLRKQCPQAPVRRGLLVVEDMTREKIEGWRVCGSYASFQKGRPKKRQRGSSRKRRFWVKTRRKKMKSAGRNEVFQLGSGN